MSMMDEMKQITILHKSHDVPHIHYNEGREFLNECHPHPPFTTRNSHRVVTRPKGKEKEKDVLYSHSSIKDNR